MISVNEFLFKIIESENFLLFKGKERSKICDVVPLLLSRVSGRVRVKTFYF